MLSRSEERGAELLFPGAEVPSQASISLLASAVDAARNGVVIVDGHWRIVVWNAWLAGASGIARGRALGQRLDKVFAEPLAERVEAAVRDALLNGRATLLSHALNPSPFPLFSPRGDPARPPRRLSQSVSVSPLVPEGEARYCLIQISDLSLPVRRERLLRAKAAALGQEVDKLTRAESELRTSEQRFRNLARQAPVGILHLDPQGAVVFFNDRLRAITGVDEGAISLAMLRDVVHGDDRAMLEQAWSQALGTREGLSVEVRLQRADGSLVWVHAEASVIEGDEGGCQGYLVTVIDVSAEKQKALRNEYLAFHDPLTGLGNRLLLEQRFRQFREQASRLVLMFIDLEHFKSINDSLGHEMGDVVLKAVAERLVRIAGSSSFVARYGGDEFVVLMSGSGASDEVRALVKTVTRTLSEPIDLGVLAAQVRPTVGVACAPEDGSELEELMRAADAAMFHARHRG